MNVEHEKKKKKGKSDGKENDPEPVHASSGVTFLAGGYFGLSLGQSSFEQSRINYAYKRFKLFSSRCPENYLHPYFLLKALRAGLKGHVRKALAYFDKSILEAERVKNTRNWAIANECKGYYLIHIEQYGSSISYLKEASYLYKLWGASAKAALLDLQVSQISAGSIQGGGALALNKGASSPVNTQSRMVNNNGEMNSDEDVNKKSENADDSGNIIGNGPSYKQHHTDGANIDIFASLKLAQTLSGVASFDQIVEKLLTLLLQNSGAQRAQFIELLDDEPCLISEAYYEKKASNESDEGVGAIKSSNDDVTGQAGNFNN